MRDSADSVLLNVSLPSQGPGRLALLLVLLTGVATTLALGAVAVHSWYGEIQRRVEAIHPAVLELSADSVAQRLGRAKAAIGEFARLSLAASNDAVHAERGREFVSRTPIFSGVVFLDGEGRVRGSAGAELAFDALVRVLKTEGAIQAGLANAMAATQLRRELATVEEASIRLFEVDGRTCVVASAPLGRGPGSLHALLRGAELSTALRTDLLGLGGIHLADERGRIVAQAGDVTPGRLSAEALAAPVTPELNVPWNAEEVWTVRSARPVGVLDLTVVVEQPILLVVGSMVLAAGQMAAAGVVVVVAFTLIASLMAVRLTRQLQVLLGGLCAIAKSDYSCRLPDGGMKGQLGLLYRGFNGMAGLLEKQSAQADARLMAKSKQNAAFAKQHELLAKLSITDGLTQLHNHRHFQDQLRREIKRLSRTNEGLSMLIIDIDDFKKLNDNYGHAAGDEFLKQLAGILKESVRETDFLARYGGEEFVVVATGTGVEGAHLLAEKLRTRVAETSFIVDETRRPRGVTVSIGVAEFIHSRTELFAAADAALYHAKAAGKNCVVVAERRAGEGAPE